jgi:hypothetical protein
MFGDPDVERYYVTPSRRLKVVDEGKGAFGARDLERGEWDQSRSFDKGSTPGYVEGVGEPL